MILALFGKRSYFRSLDLDIDILPWDMSLNHQNSKNNDSQSNFPDIFLHLFLPYDFAN